MDISNEKIDNEFKEFIVGTISEFFEEILENYLISGPMLDKIQIFFENEIGDESEAENQKNEVFQIKHWISNRSFGELIDMYVNDEITRPEMQRGFVWDSLKCSRLIESILLGLPIPALFFLEIGPNKYEVIDGLQRLTTLVNYVTGKTWNGKIGSSKLSSKIGMPSVAGKSFKELTSEQQRIIKRSTIPLIEFTQMQNQSVAAKYFIYERVNTGSEKLNKMQIRKALAYGSMLEGIYKYLDSDNKFKNYFSINKIKKEKHVEDFLRIKIMTEIYDNTFDTKVEGINNILNEYCEQKRKTKISEEYIEKFNKSIELANEIFENQKDSFKKVIKNQDNDYEFIGELNSSIMEAFLGILIKNIDSKLNKEEILRKYKEQMFTIFNSDEQNPFSVSTGQIKSIKNRFEIFERIIKESKNEGL